jgi:hypothetical protein
MNKMQIQPPDNMLNTSPVKPVQENPEPKIPASEAGANELGHAFAAAVRQALQSCQSDSSGVVEARRAIAEGRLETPEAYNAAAENMLLMGI